MIKISIQIQGAGSFKKGNYEVTTLYSYNYYNLLYMYIYVKEMV